MEDISIYLEKFKTVGIKEDKLQDHVLDTCREILKDDTIQSTDIVVRDGVVRINVSGPARTELFIQKRNIIKILSEKTRLRIDDIR